MEGNMKQSEEKSTAKTIWHRATQPSLFLSLAKTMGSHGLNIHTHASSTGTIPSISGGTIGTIETDFSDHFVVRRNGRTDTSDPPMPPPRPLMPRVGSNEFFESCFVSDFEMIGDQPQKCLLTSNENSKIMVEPENIVKTSKKLSIPFQFGKRQKTSGISSLIDCKNDGKETGLVSRYFASKCDSPISGRVLFCEPHIIPSSQSTRSTILRPLSPVHYQDQQEIVQPALPTDEDCVITPDNPEISITSSTMSLTPSPQPNTVSTLITKVKGQTPNSQINKESIRRHPFGYCLKQTVTDPGVDTMTGNKNPTKCQQPIQAINMHKPNVYRNQNYSNLYQSQLYKDQNSARGDASPKLELQNNRSSQGHPTASSLANHRVRPKTVCEGQVGYSEKMMNMTNVVKPASGTTSMFTGSHKLVPPKYFQKNDLTSPLGNFHGPIRPFVIVPSSSEDFVTDWSQRQYQSISFDHSIFETCQQKLPIPMHLVFNYLVNLRKVGEGVYGEVFKGYFKGLPDQRVYKIVPIEGSKIVNGEKQKKFEEIEPEIIIAQELNKLRQTLNGSYTDGHSKMIFTRICQGKYPTILIDLWKSWHRSYVSQNDVPDFDANQLYTVFEFEYHGTDIESYKFKNAKQSTAVLLHVIHALAAAEAACHFEHRDLHWGNILVLKTREPFTTYTIQGITFRVPNCGLKSTIIDYTISRLTSSSGTPIFTDLANDEDQFCGSEDYQFEIYRMMREENKNDWSRYCPKTNIFWAHYLVEKLIDKGRYVDTTSSIHNIFKNKLYRIQSNLLKFSSCMDCARRFLPSICRDLEFEGV